MTSVRIRKGVSAAGNLYIASSDSKFCVGPLFVRNWHSGLECDRNSLSTLTTLRHTAQTQSVGSESLFDNPSEPLRCVRTK